MAAKRLNPFDRRVDLFGNVVGDEPRGAALAEKFLAPPFTILDARQGYWKDRKAEWLALGIKGEEGRTVNQLGFSEVCNTVGGYKGKAKRNGASYNPGNFKKTDAGGTWRISPNGATGGKEFGRKSNKGLLNKGEGMEWGEEYEGGNAWAGAGSSVFDPVLCELVYKWFAPSGGHILDPFAGESTKGIVATYLGYKYTGVELRQEQIDANRIQAKEIGVEPNWIQGDSAKIASLLPPAEEHEVEKHYDLIFTSPPYYDLEIYSSRKDDGSAFSTYERFMEWYRDIFRQAVERLRWNRFLVVKIGEVRDENGWYRNFLGDNIKCFMDLKLKYYNEAVLITSIGSLPLRVDKHFSSYRKLGKTHQNILIFYKGCDPDQIAEKFGKVFDE